MLGRTAPTEAHAELIARLTDISAGNNDVYRQKLDLEFNRRYIKSGIKSEVLARLMAAMDEDFMPAEQFLLWMMERSDKSNELADKLFINQPSKMSWAQAKQTIEFMNGAAVFVSVRDISSTVFNVDDDNNVTVRSITPAMDGGKARVTSEPFTDKHLDPDALRTEAMRLISISRAIESTHHDTKRNYSEAVIAHVNNMAVEEGIQSAIAGGFL